MLVLVTSCQRSLEPSTLFCVPSCMRVCVCVQVLLEAYPKEGGKVTLNLYAYPTKPGFCRHVGRQVHTHTHIHT